MTMVDRVARAIYGDMPRAMSADGEFENLWPETQDRYRSLARAAIAAMREPTEAMQLAGHNVRNDPTTGLPVHCGTDEIYTAMIDAALAPEEPKG